MDARITVLTLGVDDLERALAFYRDGLGLASQGIIGQEFEHGAVAFFDLQPGLKLALWPRRSLAHDSGLAPASPSPANLSIGHNVGSAAEVDAILMQAVAAGAKRVKAAGATFYGGYAGYFADPDGHLWEIVHNPHLAALDDGKANDHEPVALAALAPSGVRLMADYNRWMNDRLLAAAARLSRDALFLDRGAFFGSVFGTLNHLLVGDSIWLHRFAMHPLGFPALEVMQDWPRPVSLREPLADDLAGLARRRQALDAIIGTMAAETSTMHLAADLVYRNTAGTLFRRPFGALLQHFFNHQTHHRGQLTTLLFQAGIDPGETDLLARIPARNG